MIDRMIKYIFCYKVLLGVFPWWVHIFLFNLKMNYCLSTYLSNCFSIHSSSADLSKRNYHPDIVKSMIKCWHWKDIWLPIKINSSSHIYADKNSVSSCSVLFLEQPQKIINAMKLLQLCQFLHIILIGES